MSEIMDYDPNLTGYRMAKQTVRITLGMWRYRATFEVVVEGNCKGFDVLEGAISSAYDSLPTKRRLDEDGNEIDVASVILRHGDDILHCDDDELEYEDFLKELVIACEIIAIESSK